MFKIKSTKIPNCFELQPEIFVDKRGSFIKTFHYQEFESLGLPVDWKESYYTCSAKGVLRGMHFQLPPHAHAKIVYCVSGSVVDVALDLRKGSPTYGKSIMLELSAKVGNMLYLPAGLAHGFCTPREPATLIYNVSSLYNPDSDAGVCWDSLGIDWPIREPLLSERDKAFKSLQQFLSPFEFDRKLS